MSIYESVDAIGSAVLKQGKALDHLQRVILRVADSAADAKAADKRSQALIDADARTALQAHYDEQVFAPYGERCPAPVAGADPMDYKFGLMKTVKRKLGPDDPRPIGPGSTTVGDLAGLRLGGLNDAALNAIEPELLKAAAIQADTPHVSTLPPAGQFVARHRVDDASGAKRTEFYGRRSFIADLSRPGRRILRIQDPTSGRVLAGPSYQRMPGY